MRLLFSKKKNKIALQNLKNGEIISYSYDDLHKICDKFSGVVEKYGLKPGERIAVIGKQTSESILSFLAITYNHLTSVMIDPNLPKEELVSYLEKSDVSLVLTDRDLYKKALSDENYTVLNIENSGFEPLATADKKSVIQDFDGEIALFLFSSGTSGIPKPVMITYEAILCAVRLNFDTSNLGNDASLLCAFPVYHAGGFYSAISVLLTGCCLDTVSGYSIEKSFEYMRLLKATHFGMIPPVLENLFSLLENVIKTKSPSYQKHLETDEKIAVFLKKHFRSRKISRLLMKKYTKEFFGEKMRCIYAGAMKSEPSLAKKVQKYGFDWFDVYASTECGCPVTATDVRLAYSENSCAKIDWNEKIDLKISCPDKNGIGELLVKSPMNMKGYFREKEMTEKAFDKDGFYRTGDLAYTDEKNYLHLVGRKSEIIHLRNGEKLSPEIAEKTILPFCPENNPAIVCPIPSDDGSFDAIHVFLEDRGYSDEEKKSISENILSSRALIPLKAVHFVNHISYTAVHKPKRFELSKEIGHSENSSDEPKTPYECFLYLAKEYLPSGTSVSSDDKIENSGLDSLSVFTLASEMEKRFGIDLVPMLSTSSTFGELKSKLESGEKTEKEKIKLRKIRKDELREMSVLRTECMLDYPLYVKMYSDPKRRRKQLYVTSWYILYMHLPFTYINDEKTLLFSVKKPGDKYKPLIGLLLDLRFDFAFIKNATFGSLKRLRAYIDLENETEKRHYDPMRDHYVCNICIAKKERGKGIYDKLMSMLDENNRYYFVTHSPKNAQLYEKYGSKLCETSEWEGVTHYCYIKEPKNTDDE